MWSSAHSGSRGAVMLAFRLTALPLALAGFSLVSVDSAAGSSGHPGAASASVAQRMSRESGPVAGIIALGHSGLTGENSNPQAPGQPALDNSWATGSNPRVGSIYLRMLKRWPETKGKVANVAQGGAAADQLASQARTALTLVPAPALAIIQTIDNDIRCDGTDAQHVPEFGRAVDDALAVITKASPSTRILMITQPGRPALELKGMAGLIKANPAVKALYTGPPPCAPYSPDGRLQPKNVRALTAIIESYEAEQARVCAKYPACSTDGGALATYMRTPTLVSQDFNHLSVAGLALLARQVFPFARRALARPPT